MFSLPYFLLNLCLAGVIAFPSLILNLVADPYERGFYCNDPVIRHPYKDSTISSLLAYLIGFLVPLTVICVVEIAKASYTKRKRQRQISHEEDLEENRSDRGQDKSKRPFWEKYSPYANILNLIAGYLLAVAINQVLTDTGKYTIGRLRPHFLEVCNPDFTKIQCYDENNLQIFVTDYKCRGNEELFPDDDESDYRVKESRLSFPSGHASFSTMSMLFLMLYLQFRLTSGPRSPWSTYLVPFGQVCCAIWAFYVCLSRVSDYKHNPGDVIGGAILGALCAIFVVVYVLKMFARLNPEYEDFVDGERMPLSSVASHNSSRNSSSSNNVATSMRVPNNSISPSSNSSSNRR